MKIEIREDNNKLYVSMDGRLDTAAASEVEPQYNEIIESSDKEIHLNFKNLEYISSSGLRLLISLRKSCAIKGGKIIIENINDDIRKIFVMTGFYNLFEIKD